MPLPHSAPAASYAPFALWADVAFKTTEMMWSAASVIAMRTARMAAHGLQPNAADQRELQLMGQEKLAAATASGSAVFDQLQRTNWQLMQRALQNGAQSYCAWIALAGSRTPGQAFARGQSLLSATTRAAASGARLSDAAARVTQRGLKPIHSAATGNARRLSAARKSRG